MICNILICIFFYKRGSSDFFEYLNIPLGICNSPIHTHQVITERNPIGGPKIPVKTLLLHPLTNKNNILETCDKLKMLGPQLITKLCHNLSRGKL